MTKEAILVELVKSLEEILAMIPEADISAVSSKSILIGDDSPLESIHFVQFLFECEERISDKFDFDITLTDDRAMSLRSSPFRTLDTLSEFIENEMKNG